MHYIYHTPRRQRDVLRARERCDDHLTDGVGISRGKGLLYLSYAMYSLVRRFSRDEPCGCHGCALVYVCRCSRHGTAHGGCVGWRRASPSVAQGQEGSSPLMELVFIVVKGSSTHLLHLHYSTPFFSFFVFSIHQPPPQVSRPIPLRLYIFLHLRTSATAVGDLTRMLVVSDSLPTVFFFPADCTGPEGSDGGRWKGESVISTDGGACREVGGCWGGSVFQAFRRGHKKHRSG